MTEALQLPVGSGFIPQTATSAASPTSEVRQTPTFLPIQTKQKIAKDAELVESVELRAYKLGKKRWLYNECRLNLISEGGYYPQLEVAESSRQGEDQIPEQFQDCGVAYLLKLKNSSSLKLDLEVFVGFDNPQPSGLCPEPSTPGMIALQGSLDQPPSFRWPLVQRCECQKNCTGPILRSIQRYGRISRRTGKKQPEAEVPEDRAKDPRYLYLSIDEASTHVGGKRFRLIAAVYDSDSRKLLGSCCSLPIQVLANNDAPNGPATIDLDIPISSSWEGWAAVQEASSEDQLRNNSAESLQREHYPLDASEPCSSVHAGSSWYSGVPQTQTSKAKIDLQYIRERAMLSGEDEDGTLTFEDALPATKRSRSTYGLDADVPLPAFYHKMDSSTPRLTSSAYSSVSTYLTPDRLRLDPPADHSTLDSTPVLQELDPVILRHGSVTESSFGTVRHGSLPLGLPDLSVMQGSGGTRSMADAALRRNSSTNDRMRYNSAPFQGGLLSELQAHRSSHALDARENLLWASLNNPQSFPSQGSVVRQASSPATLLQSQTAEAFHWGSGRPCINQAQNPSVGGLNPSVQISNPFAQHEILREEAFWGNQVQALSSPLGRRLDSSTREKAL